MGADLFDHRPDLLGPSADEVLGWSLRDVCLNGPEEELVRTDRAQPALYALAFALWMELSERVPVPGAAAGHSLGEYTALGAAGVFGYEPGLALVAARGRAMADAAGREPSTMAAVMGIDTDRAAAAAEERRAAGGKLWVANFNGPGQVVFAGGAHDVEWLVAHAGEYGGRRVIPLSVAGAFHSPFMEEAVGPLAAALDATDFAPPAFPVWANLTAGPVEDHRAALLQQLVAPVLFTQTLEGMGASGIRGFLHIGPGTVTATIAKRTVNGADTHSLNRLEGIDEAVAWIESLVQ